jgi:hypothetical protein
MRFKVKDIQIIIAKLSFLTKISVKYEDDCSQLDAGNYKEREREREKEENRERDRAASFSVNF